MLKNVYKLNAQTWRIISTTVGITSLSLLNSSFLSSTQAQQTPADEPLYTLGFYLVNSEQSAPCRALNGTMKIEGETIETDKKGKQKRKKIKTEATFRNGQLVSQDSIVQSAESDAYGTFYYLSSNLVGKLKVKSKMGKDKSQFEFDFDTVPVQNPTPGPNQVLQPITTPRYVDFSVPCT
jgi:hypothetical protein